jgi:hypothetical protein
LINLFLLVTQIPSCNRRFFSGSFTKLDGSLKWLRHSGPGDSLISNFFNPRSQRSFDFDLFKYREPVGTRKKNTRPSQHRCELCGGAAQHPRSPSSSSLHGHNFRAHVVSFPFSRKRRDDRSKLQRRRGGSASPSSRHLC